MDHVLLNGVESVHYVFLLRTELQRQLQRLYDLPGRLAPGAVSGDATESYGYRHKIEWDFHSARGGGAQGLMDALVLQMRRVFCNYHLRLFPQFGGQAGWTVAANPPPGGDEYESD